MWYIIIANYNRLLCWGYSTRTVVIHSIPALYRYVIRYSTRAPAGWHVCGYDTRVCYFMLCLLTYCVTGFGGGGGYRGWGMVGYGKADVGKLCGERGGDVWWG